MPKKKASIQLLSVDDTTSKKRVTRTRKNSIPSDTNSDISLSNDMSTSKDTSTSNDTSRTKVSIPIPRTNPNAVSRLIDIKWSKFIPHTPTPKQYAAMMLSNCSELLYGGALGGGKSDFLAYEALRYCDLPDFTSIIFRKQLTDLKQPKSLIPRVATWLQPFVDSGDARYIAADHCWHFKTMYPGTDISGPEALLQWGYIGDAGVRDRYQSAEYQLVAFDELGQWNTPVDYLFMTSRLRATVCPIHKKDENDNPIWNDNCHICRAKRMIPLRLRAAMNPGPAWVKKRFRIVPDPKLYKTKQQALIAMQEGIKINWVGTHPTRRFIPAYLSDNPHLGAKDYRQMLAQMPPEERERLEDGNWEARKDSRFKRKWIMDKYINVYSNGYSYIMENGRESVILPFSTLLRIFVTVDTASTAKLFTSKEDELINIADGRSTYKPSSTGIAVWGVTKDEHLLWLDFRKFRKELPDIIDELVDINRKWNPKYNKIEINGVGIGVAQYAHQAGLRVKKNQRKVDKLENSLAAQMLMSNGYIYFPINAPWIEDAEDDIFNWSGNPEEEDDTIDVLADAATEVSPRVARKISMPERKPSVGRAVGNMGTVSNIPHYGLKLR
jgi:predicted phage terminase large subunit-like protein